MKRKNLLIFCLLLSKISFACDCEYGGNFIHASTFSELIIKGKVIDKLYNFEDGKIISKSNEKEFEEYLFKKDQEFFESIKIEIIELIKGEEKRKVVYIYGTDGVDCRAGVSGFLKGKTYIISLSKTIKSNYNLPNETENDFHIDGCSENILEYLPETNEVYGQIEGKSPERKNKKYSYQKLKRKII